jgi:prophage regulatory protein
MASDNPRRPLRLPEVVSRIGLSRSWIYQAIAEGRFPKWRKIGAASCLDSFAIDDWIARQAGEQ